MPRQSPQNGLPSNGPAGIGCFSVLQHNHWIQECFDLSQEAFYRKLAPDIQPFTSSGGYRYNSFSAIRWNPPNPPSKPERDGLDTMNGPRSYDNHLKYSREWASLRGWDEYQERYRQSVQMPERFWETLARQYLSWEREWEFVLRYDFDAGEIQWFGGGLINACYNCVDRHLERLKNHVAYYWEGDDPHQKRTVTYLELYDQVNRCAAVLQSRGVGKGDRVVIYLPMVIELPVAMLACARIGAVHCVVFGGVGPRFLAERIRNCGARTVITADAALRKGKVIPYKTITEEALRECPHVETVIMLNRGIVNAPLREGRDLCWKTALSDPSLPCHVRPEPMDAEDPLFILYTSVSMGRPVGLVHTHGGYLLHAAVSTAQVFDARAGETFWCTADIGWITGHSYSVYGPLLNGLTSVLYEGSLTYPSAHRCWQIIQRYRVDRFYTAPTVVRAFAETTTRQDLQRYDLSSLKLLATVGEPIDPATWEWFYQEVGQERCPVIDTWWQTETGGHAITPFPAVRPLKPGSCSFPFFGVDPVILDQDTGEEIQFPNQEGALFIRHPWPGIARTVYGDHERYRETYFTRFPGMFFTGDGARRDEDGYYWITGRIDEIINVSGYRLGPFEAEAALVTHPLVEEAAVVGIPHKRKGQGIYAFVKLAEGVESSDELKREIVDLLRSSIGPVATPDVIHWANALPKTRSGKVLRRLLSKIAAGELENLGDTSIIANLDALDSLVRERLEISW